MIWLPDSFSMTMMKMWLRAGNALVGDAAADDDAAAGEAA
jgi:hypothetical protein